MNRRRLLQSGTVAFVGMLPMFGTACAALSASPEQDTDPFMAAFYYAFPLYELARIEQERTGAVNGQPGQLNVLAHRSRLLDHTSMMVTAPNNDTFYSSCFFELSGGPVELIVPSSTDRYFSVAFMQAFTDVFAYVGTRATQGQGGRFWIVGPDWHGQAPDGVRVIQAPSYDVWMLVRTLVDGPDDVEAATAFQHRFSVIEPSGRPPARGFSVAAVDARDPVNFLSLVNEVIARNPGRPGIFARAEGFSALGIGVDGLPAQEVLDRWRDAISTGLAELQRAFRFRDDVVDGWSYTREGVGDFHENDHLRATVALGGMAALTPDEAMYFHVHFGPDGQLLSGIDNYRWRVPPGGVPVDAFWSLSMYRVTPEGRYFFVENPINRYSIGDRTPGLIVEPDGSMEILIQHARPEGPMAANWLPSPAGPMRLGLRAYLPRPELRDRSWLVPPLRRVG